MKFKTSITEIKDNGKEFIYGHDLQDLARNNSFTQAIFLLLRGRLPEDNEAKLFGTILTVAIDHGPGTVSAQTSRIVASAKNSLHTSVAAGILAMGERHGSAIAPAMEFFYNHADESDVVGLVKNLKDQKIRIPGYGHAVLTHGHRAETILGVAKETGFYGKHCTLAETVLVELNKISSKQLPLNVDGGMAAALCDMGFDARMAKGIFIIARTPGLVAQVFEEIERDDGIRRLPNEDVDFINKP